MYHDRLYMYIHVMYGLQQIRIYCASLPIFYLKTETKATHKRYIVMRSVIGKSEITPEQIESLHYMMQQILQHSRVSPSWENDLQQIAKDEVTKESPKNPKREQKQRSIANREELRQKIFETGNAISKSSKMSFDAFSQIISFIATFQKSTNLSLEAVRSDGLYVQGYENTSQSPATKEACQRTVSEFLTSVFHLLGYDMQKSNISTQTEYLNEEVFTKTVKRRWTNHTKSRQTTTEGKQILMDSRGEVVEWVFSLSSLLHFPNFIVHIP